jgi:hypothetical protein
MEWGNSYGDIIIGAPGHGANLGRVLRDFNFGNPGGLAWWDGYGGNLGRSVAAGYFLGSNDYFYGFVAGAPYDDVGSASDAGSVEGPFHYRVQANMGGFSEASDNFGWAVATGSFAGYSDALVVGAPFEDYGAPADAGAVYICNDPYYLDCGTVWTQNSSGVADTAEAGDQFGYAFSVGADVPGGRKSDPRSNRGLAVDPTAALAGTDRNYERRLIERADRDGTVKPMAPTPEPANDRAPVSSLTSLSRLPMRARQMFSTWEDVLSTDALIGVTLALSRTNLVHSPTGWQRLAQTSSS